MNDPLRSDRDRQSFAVMGSLASVPACQARTERKCLRKDWFGALLALLGGLTTFGVMAACGSGAAKSSFQETQTPLISVALTQGPPSSMIAGNSAIIAAAVTNDPANAGVDWVATCTITANINPPCGSFNPSHTASGARAIYTAPPGIPSKNAVTLTALSTTDRGKSTSWSVSITSTVTGIAITTPLPGIVPGGATLNFGATVYGDPANLGTDWAVTCLTPNGLVDCSPSPNHVIAGATLPFTVPETATDPVTKQVVSLAGSTIMITAYATADHTKFATFGPVSVTAPISIGITRQPPPTLLTGATAQVIATVANDTTNSGVTWGVGSCNQPDCGSIIPMQTASGVAATYTAPATVPSPNPVPGLTITIVATAKATINPTSPHPPVQTTITINIVAPVSVALTKGNTITSIVANRTAQFAATVSNDFSNAGLDWTISCGSPGACGAFSPTHTDSGATTTYTAPSAVPSGATVTITATSTADTTKSVQSQPITIQQAGDPKLLLSGQFVLYLSAKNSQNGPFVFGGVITGDGNGNIVSGHFDLADASGNSGFFNSFGLAGTSPYLIGSDGRGQITLTLNPSVLLNNSNPSPSFGVPVPGSNLSTLTLSVVFVTVQLDPATGKVLHEHALVAETDAFGDATGTLDLQDTAALGFLGLNAALNGTYSLQLSGTPGFFVDAALNMQPSSLSAQYCTLARYTADQSRNGVITSVSNATASQTFTSCNLSSASSGGRLTLNSVNLGLPASFSLDVWFIDANHFVVTDPYVLTPLVGGYLTAQPATSALPATPLAFTESGATTASVTSAGQPQVAGGVLTCGGSNGSLDVVPLNGTALTGQQISATCGSADPNGRSLITITGAGSSGISQFAAYPTVDGSFYLLELDGGVVGTSGAGTSGPSGAGVAYTQNASGPISASIFNGAYAAQFAATTQPGFQAFTGKIISDGTSAINGTVDVNSFTTSPASGTGGPSAGASLTGSFTTSSNGRFPLTFTITPTSGQPTPQITTLNAACYIVDPNTCLLLGLDATAPGTGILLLQNTGL